MGHIWFDVTTILSWQRSAVGVVRVEAECARHALDSLPHSVRFCRFDQDCGYTIVKGEEVRLALDRISGDRTADPKTATSSPHTIITSEASPRRSAPLIRTLERRLLERTPPRFRDPLRRLAIATIDLAKALQFALINRTRRLWFGSRDYSSNVPSENAPNGKRGSPFTREDVYVSLGLDWDQKSTAFIGELKAKIGFKALFCCYDIIPVKFPHLCVGDVAARFAHYFADLAWCADQFVAISECSKRDLLGLLSVLGAPIPRTSVITLGADLSKGNREGVTHSTMAVATGDFILFVSTIERRKNHETIYRAITKLVDKGFGQVPTVIFVGMQGWGVGDLLSDLKFDPRVRDKIRILNHVNDVDLAWLYEKALFTVFPSLYEGWGLAVGESLAAGKFCLCSNVASLPEVGGDLVEYLDPWNVQEWADRFEHYLTHRDELAQRERMIREQYISPKWTDTASRVFDVATELLESAPPSRAPINTHSELLGSAGGMQPSH